MQNVTEFTHGSKRKNHAGGTENILEKHSAHELFCCYHSEWHFRHISASNKSTVILFGCAVCMGRAFSSGL